MGEESTSARTVADAPAAKREVSEHTSIATPQQAMHLLEARRAWTYAFGLGMLATIAFVVVWCIGGDPLAQRVHLVGLGGTAVAMGLYALLRRDPARYRRAELFALIAVAMAANATGFFYWGVYSAFLAVIASSGYAVASGSGRRGAILAAVVVIAMQCTLGIAQIAGLIGEHGLVVMAPWTSKGAMIVALVLMQLMVIASVAGGMDSKAQMQRVLDEHHAALRALSQRDAQLAEAHQEVREARGAGEGRFTGEQLGPFVLGEVLGRGAMGEVYAASDAAGEPCAVKVLAPHLAGDAAALQRFHREARAIAGLDAPNIVRMLDVSPADAPHPYFAMERLDGCDLAEFVKDRPVRALDEVVGVVAEIAAGLDAAHAAGVVHRDLKPANVFAATTPAGLRWKILDFGVSKLFGPEATATAGHLVGTPGYMAPEQASGGEIDRRADVYSLGVLAYRMLTGRPAVVPGELPKMIHEVVFRMPPAPSAFAQVLPAVEAVLAVALAKSPTDRFGSAGELAGELARAAAGRTSATVAARAAALVSRTPWGQWLRAEPRTVVDR